MHRVTCALLVACSGLLAQAPPTFEVVSVKASPPPDNPKRPAPGSVTYDPKRFTAVNMPLKFLFLDAFGLQQYQLAGAPSWIESEKFDIVAVAAQETGKAQMRLMLQVALKDRFHLEYRQETRQSNVYAITLGQGGPKFGPNFHAVKEDDPKPVFPAVLGGPIHPRYTMNQLASFLSQTQTPDPEDGRPVIDETGLMGLYDIVLTGKTGEWFDAVQTQLGLKILTRKGPVEYFTITNVERPTAN